MHATGNGTGTGTGTEHNMNMMGHDLNMKGGVRGGM